MLAGAVLSPSSGRDADLEGWTSALSRVRMTLFRSGLDQILFFRWALRSIFRLRSDPRRRCFGLGDLVVVRLRSFCWRSSCCAAAARLAARQASRRRCRLMCVWTMNVLQPWQMSLLQTSHDQYVAAGATRRVQ